MSYCGIRTTQCFPTPRNKAGGIVSDEILAQYPPGSNSLGTASRGRTRAWPAALLDGSCREPNAL